MLRLTISIILLGQIISCGTKNVTNNGPTDRVAIFDEAQMLSKSSTDSLDYLIRKLEGEVGSQIAIVTTTSLGEQTIENFGFETFERMGLGREEYNDGVLISISLYDKTARIDVGLGLENIIEDEVAGKLLIEDLNPNFVQEKYGLGLYVVIEKISELIKNNKSIVGQRPEYLEHWDSLKKAYDSIN